MRLVGFELKKLFDKGTLVYIMVVVIFANLFLIWTNSDVRSTVASSGSYRALTKDIEGLSLDEKKQFLDQNVEMFYALMYMERFLLDGIPFKTDEFLEFEQEYGDIYNFKRYNLYTESISQEYLFFSEIQSELNTVYDYEGFLNSTTEQADIFSQISIFQTTDEEQTFSSLNTQKTVEAYQQLLTREIEIDYFPQKGVFTAIDFLYTDVFILLFMILIAGQIISSERESGMLYYIRTTPKGRLKTAAAKVGALCVSLFFVLVGLYGTNLLFCEIAFGLGNLSRSVQSLPFLFRSTMDISVFEYLIIFIGAKWFVSVVLGIFIMFVILCTKKLVFGLVASFAVLGLQLAIRVYIEPLSTYGVLRHANFVGFLEVNEWLGSYRNLYWFDKPIEMIKVVLISALIFLIVLTGAFLIYFTKSYISPAKVTSRKRFKYQKHTSILREELFKLVLTNGVILILVGYVGYNIYQGVTSESYITPTEIYYRHYIEPLSGRYTNEKYLWLTEQSEEFNESYSMDKMYQSEQITENEYLMYKSGNYSLYSRRDAFEGIIHEEIPYILENDGAQFVNPAGYMILFDLYDNQTTLTQTVVSALLISLCVSGVFSLERQSGMERILKTTPLGKFRVKKNKIIISAVIVVIITIATLAPSYIQVVRDYGLLAFFAPIKSLRMFFEMPNVLTFFSLSLATLVVRLAAGALIAMTAFFLQTFTKRTLTVVAVNLILYCVPPLLALYGVDNMRFFGVYPLFHIAQFLTEPYGGAIVVASAVCAVFFVVLGGMFLFDFERDDFEKREETK